MPAAIPPLDEQEYGDPQMPLAHLDSDNNAIFYLMNSPFFDGASNNSAVYSTAQGHPNGMQLLNDRPTYEAELRKYNAGLQFIVASEPKAEGQPWLIQRQRKVLNQEGAAETVTEGNFYTQGTRLLMAPSLLDVVQARLLTVSTRLQQMSELSKNMSHWSPATGHTYLPPSFELAKASDAASRAGSRAGSPILAPTDPDAARAASQPPTGAAGKDGINDPSAASSTGFNDAFFLHSLHLTHAYGDEFMDENPLLGEPGAFVFTTSRSALDARNKAAQEQASAAAATAAAAASQPSSQGPLHSASNSQSVAPSAAATPRGVASPMALDAPSRKGSVAGLPKEERRKRRKSRGLASPTTPAGPGPTL
ncbi:Mediator of RNA polymerase II transcription subunit 6 [Curvularia kusanoi]|uniref:Mediator of RNA polymerase II transcription subunit 6 n=1 Tax=Curvularia kusanoi TaxID=90978 RepID=A0A9P4W715_CURKU|nr:Mediator of RNA polymerase II transcription subunit 6 [Curvularia kusanoi]